MFPTLDTSITVTSGTAVYSLPASHVFTLQAWLAGAELRITPVRELGAIDSTWPITSGPSTRASFDAGSVGTITLYPNPTVGGTLAQVCEEYPATVSVSASTIALPTVLQDFFAYACLAGARGKESDGMQIEMGEHLPNACGCSRP